MVAKLLSTFALTLAAFGCASQTADDAPQAFNPHPMLCASRALQVRLASDLPADSVPAIERAFSEWSDALGGQVSWTFEVGEAKDAFVPCQVNVVWSDTTSNYADALRLDNEDGTTSSGVIRLHRPRLGGRTGDLDLVHAVVLHELGHVLGLTHDESRVHETVMWPFITSPAKLGCEDVRRACDKWSCQAACEGDGWL